MKGIAQQNYIAILRINDQHETGLKIDCETEIGIPRAMVHHVKKANKRKTAERS